MTVSASYDPIEYPGAGVAAPLVITWSFTSPTDLIVTEIDDATTAETPRYLGVHFTVTQTDSGGTVTPVSALAVGKTWRIERSTPMTQPDQLRLGGSFSEHTVERMFDRQMRALQEVESRVASGDNLLRGDLERFYGPSLVADFGGIGNNAADNIAAFAAAEASVYPSIYLPAGIYYTTSSAFALTKRYHGPGQIRFSSGTRAPGHYTWVTERPETGTGTDFDRFFSADLSNVDASLFTLGGSGANLRKGLTEPYFESCTTPKFNAFINWSGWSGVSARLTVAALVGAGSVTVNSAAGITIGQSLGFSASTGDPATQSVAETVTVTGVVGNVISFTPNLANAYSIGARVTLGTRTMNPLEYGHVRHFGGGDAYVHVARMDVGYTRTSGQDHFFFTATGGLYGGEVNGTTEGVFLTGTEIKLVDNGNAVAAIGDIRNLQRTNATNTLGQRWGGYQVKSEGVQAVDWFYQGIGKSKRGIDFALADFGTDKGAIALAQNHRIYFKASGTADVAGFTLFGNIVGDCWMEYSSGVGGLNFVVGSTSAVQMTNLKVTTLVDAQFSAKAGFNGTAPIAKPTVTGSRGSNAALASLLTAFSSYGLITDSTTA